MVEFSGRGEPLTADGVARAADLLGVPLPVLWAVITVETAGCGFLHDRRPVVLFERHEFRRRTAGRFDASHPDISGPRGGYGPGGPRQHARLSLAIGRDRRAALESASWGLGPMMGYTAVRAGHADAEAMVEQFCRGEDAQLLGMARFILDSKLGHFLKQQAWADFARRYNGPGYAANRYDARLAESYARFASQTMPDLQLRAVQLLLTYEGFSPGPVDGSTGPRTRDAVARFRAANQLGRGTTHDAELLAALLARLPPTRRPDPPKPSGDVRPDLRLLQQMLAANGLEPGPADGLDGPLTRATFRRVEARSGAVASGQVTPDLLDRLIDTALQAPTPPRPLVTSAQAALQALGFDPGPIDGIWGPRAVAAANALRSRDHLPPTETLDAPLLARLFQRSSA